MYLFSICIIFLSFSVQLTFATEYSPDSTKICQKAFSYKSDDYAVANTIKICSNADKIPFGYETDLNMVVCDDKLCANLYLKLYWDLAGNYMRFDTIPGKGLTKFDHKRFTDRDYQKLDQILKDRNSMLGILEKTELIDKSIKLRATTVDAVTGATPTTIKNAVVEGAVYSSYTLWHFANGPVGDSIRAYTRRIYSEQIARQMLESHNFETQLFALRRMTATDYESHFEILFQVIRQSVPLIKAYIISKAPLPFQDQEKNKKFVSLFPELDGYSKSIFLNRILADKELLNVFSPLILSDSHVLNEDQINKLKAAHMK